MKTKPTEVPVETFLSTVSEKRQAESHALIDMMRDISGEEPYMFGPSIIGFGTTHYRHDTGTEGNVPSLAFSPRKASLTVYFDDFNTYTKELKVLGKHKSSVSCLYINKLEDIDLSVLRTMLERSYTGTS